MVPALFFCDGDAMQEGCAEPSKGVEGEGWREAPGWRHKIGAKTTGGVHPCRCGWEGALGACVVPHTYEAKQFRCDSVPGDEPGRQVQRAKDMAPRVVVRLSHIQQQQRLRMARRVCDTNGLGGGPPKTLRRKQGSHTHSMLYTRQQFPQPACLPACLPFYLLSPMHIIHRA